MNDLTIFDTVLIWDKVMNVEEREYLVKNHMMYVDADDKNNEKFEQTVVMHAENMNDYQVGNLYSAMILSPKTKYYQKRLVTIENDIEKSWNEIVKYTVATDMASNQCQAQRAVRYQVNADVSIVTMI